jgi:uncharacterized protein (TIGR02217 family)
MGTFLETPRFPDDLAIWALGGVCFNTTVVGSTSGREERNVLWQVGRGRWDLQNTFRKNGAVTDGLTVQYLRNFFRYMKGQAYGFRFKDWTDYQDEGNGLLGAPITTYAQAFTPSGTGLGVPQYQMFKQYAAAPLADYRLIQKPYSGNVPTNIYRGGVLVAQGSAAGNCAVDSTTGLVTFVPDSTTAITGWTPGSTTAFTVAAVPAAWAVGKELYFSGITGDTSSVLNGQAVAITAISGTSVTVGASTTGDTLSGGSAAYYPQPTETLTWTGEFDVPCRFATDQFSPQLDVGSGALYGFQTLQIVEIRI